MRVLCVDDKEANLYLLETLLRGSGYEVVCAPHGVEALAQLERTSFDLIVSDILMPRMDGFQFCREVKRREHLRRIPFIFYTATYTERKDEELGLSLGAVRFIIKPQEPEAFLAILREVIAEQARQAPPAAPVASPEDGDFLIAYNQRLVHKLEWKIQQLEAMSKELQRALDAQQREIFERRRAEEEARRRNRELTLLNRVLEASAGGAPPPVLLETVCRELAQAFGLPQAVAIVWNEERTALSLAAEYALPDYPAAIRAPLLLIKDPGMAARFESREPWLIADPSRDPRAEAWRELLGVPETAAWLDLPLVRHDEVLGHLALTAPNAAFFSPATIALAWTVAVQAAKELAFARLGETQRRLTAALEQTPETVLVTDVQGRILYVNPAFERVSGYARAETRGQTPRLLKSGRHDAAFYRDIWTRLGNGEVWRGRLINKKKDGTLFTEDAVIAPVRDERGRIVNYLAVKRDITRELHLEEQYRQAQKMEAVGQLAGGVAHDFNNILTAMLMQLGLLIESPELSSEVHSGLKEIEEGARRASSLTRQLLLFSRQRVMQAKPVELNSVVGGVVKMLRRIVGEHIQLDWVAAPEPVWLLADAGMIEQVVMNLCVNGRDAMPQGGPLTLAVTQREWRPEPGAGADKHPPGRHACLSVTDVGCGMDEATRQHLFEPFFTTKEAGRGTGLGLATVRRIVKQHRGWIEVESAPGAGSTFRVFLPVLTEAVVGIEAAIPAARGGRETLLLVEDDLAVRQFTAQVLRRHGYRVIEASHGNQALEEWERHGGRIDLLLTDMLMPEGMTGEELSARLRMCRAELKTLLFSGYRLEARPGLRYLTKPCDHGTLLRSVREYLDEASTASEPHLAPVSGSGA